MEDYVAFDSEVIALVAQDGFTRVKLFNLSLFLGSIQSQKFPCFIFVNKNLKHSMNSLIMFLKGISYQV